MFAYQRDCGFAVWGIHGRPDVRQRTWRARHAYSAAPRNPQMPRV